MRMLPILFTDPMVRAIQQGRKVKTRRPVRIVNGELQECPYGTAGDRLYVREAWRMEATGIRYRADNALVPLSATDLFENREALKHGDHWRPSIHLKREHSRILLDVASVHVEKLSWFLESDAEAEGFSSAAEFREAWCATYGADAWEKNSDVFVVSFKPVEGGAR